MVKIEGLSSVLESHRFFQDFSPEVAATVAGCATNMRFEAGEYVFREGGRADKFYLLRDGQVALELNIPGRQPMIVDTLHEGDVLGWSWIVPPYKWIADAHAVQPSRVISLDARCLREKMEQDNTLGYELYKRFVPVMANRLRATRLRLIDLYGLPNERGA